MSENGKWRDPGKGQFNYKAEAGDPALSIQVGESAIAGKRRASMMRKVCFSRRDGLQWAWQEVVQGVGSTDMEAMRALYRALQEMLGVCADFGKRVKELS